MRKQYKTKKEVVDYANRTRKAGTTGGRLKTRQECGRQNEKLRNI